MLSKLPWRCKMLLARVAQVSIVTVQMLIEFDGCREACSAVAERTDKWLRIGVRRVTRVMLQRNPVFE